MDYTCTVVYMCALHVRILMQDITITHSCTIKAIAALWSVRNNRTLPPEAPALPLLPHPPAPTCLFVYQITAPSVSTMLYTCAKFRQRKAIRGSAKQLRTSAHIGPAVTQTTSVLVGKQTAEQRSGLSAVKTGGPTFPSVSTFCGLLNRLL